MKRVPTILAFCITLALACPALAQNTPAPKVIQVTREEVKPGRGAAHEKLETSWARMFAKHEMSAHYSAWTTMTGPNEAWFITGYDSMAAWEKANGEFDKNPTLQADNDRLSAQDAENVSGSRGFTAIYREDLSHRPGVSIPMMRYFTVAIVRIRPGHNEDYEELRKMNKAAHEKAGVKDNHSVFQVTAGMPAGTFLVFTPMRSLAEIDAGPQVHGKEYQDAIGDDGRKRQRELATAAVISSETILFSVNPKMSYPPKEWAAMNPDFWTPKAAAPAAMPVAKKDEAKPAKTPTKQK